MSWKKYFRPVNSVLPSSSIGSDNSYATVNKYNNWLPEIYEGPTDRLERYQIYETMNLDPEVNQALDTIADFSTENDAQSKKPFVLDYHEDPSPKEVDIITRVLKQWCILNEFDQRMWSMFRSTLQYGDQFFIRDPETYKLFWCDPNKVTKVVVNESEGKRIEAYYVKDLDLNLGDMIATGGAQNGIKGGYGGAGGIMYNQPTTSSLGYGSQVSSSGVTDGKFGEAGEIPVDADHIVHMTLCDGMTGQWPFGTSILEYVYKVYKQKELLEDSILIYRVHRAPERRVFFIDVGSMPPNKAQQYLERVKYEVQQKRIPSRDGGGQSVVDSAYNPMCLSLDTEIAMLNGSSMKLSDIIIAHNNQEELWTYSCDPVTGKIAPGKIDWAGITKKNANTIRITLDNGKTVTCTPEHKFPVLNKGFVEARHLTEQDSLISHETKFKSLSNDKKRSYEQVFDHESNKWVYTHRMVAEHQNRQAVSEYTYKTDEDKTVVHHIDFDRYNNFPANLTWMGRHDHFDYHSCHKKEFWKSLSIDESKRIKDKIRKSLYEYRKTITTEQKAETSKKQSAGQIAQYKNVQGTPKFQEYCDKISVRQKEFYLQDTAQVRAIKQKSAISMRKNRALNQHLNFTFEMLQHIAKVVNDHDLNRLDAIAFLNEDTVFIDIMKDANPVDPKSTHNIKNEVFTNSKLIRMYKKFGYVNWKDFKSKSAVFNHRIVKIEKDVTQDVGTLTIDIHEQYHDYHTFALSCGVFTKNSSLEDYFFATTPEGRGSKVETLPGGDNLGDIDDLRYFNNKVLRALGVPSSYLPSGPEDGSAGVNDGRVGTAFIQEFRFSKVCERYQKQLSKTFDKEFKLFLKKKGVQIDNSLFTLKFPEPQSFSEYRQLELDSAKINTFAAMSDIPYLSKRFALSRYLGLTEEEMRENEKLWQEEKGMSDPSSSDTKADLSSAGITSSGIETMAPEGGFDEEFADEGEDISDDDIDGFGDEEPIGEE